MFSNRISMRVVITVAILFTATAPQMACRDAPATAPSGAMVIEFNRTLLARAEREDRFLTLKGVRSVAMMHLAAHDALNSIDPRYTTYLSGDVASGAHPIAAAVSASYEVAVSQYPDAEREFAALRARWMPTDADSGRVGAGIELGRESALRILEARRTDRFDGEAEYRWHPMAPGVYAEFSEHSGTPHGFVFGAGWAQAQPFALEGADQFLVPPPPPIESEAYAKAFDEVKELGRYHSASRSEDQTHLAMWWKDFVENSHNRLARELTEADRLDLWDASRLFALLNVSIYDAYVCVFANKFHYNHWRPYTAIRWAEHDGNPSTAADPDWDNLHRHTYAFPSYPSAHGCASASAMSVMAATFGTERPFTMTTRLVDRSGPLSEKIVMEPPTRSFDDFDAAAMEAALSRVYLGIHFRYDSEEGFVLGKHVGGFVVANLLPRIAD